MTRDFQHDPCSDQAREEGCTCRLSSVNSATIDPPEPIIDKNCPLHGWAPDPDEEYERRRDDDDEDWRAWEWDE